MSDYRPSRRPAADLAIALVRTAEEIGEINRIYAHHGMMTVDPEFLWRNRNSRSLTYLVAKDAGGRVLGVVMGADHRHAFHDPDHGSSLDRKSTRLNSSH